MKRVADSLRRDEEPPRIWRNSCALSRMHTATKREVVLDAVGGATPELNPGVAEPILVLVHEEVPFHPLCRIAIRLNAVGIHRTVEKKRKLQRQHARLARSVIAAKEKPAIFKQELLLVVFVDVQDPAAQRLPALALWPRKRSWRGAIS